jgi:oligoribonuclease
MEATMRHEFLWIDLETTGLDPKKGVVLEYAAVLCEDWAGGDFAVSESHSGVIWHDEPQQYADEYVQKMHDTNGLWEDVGRSYMHTSDADYALAELARSMAGGHRITLAGSSVHFDLAWCREHFPRFSEYLGYRIFDVSTLRKAAEAWTEIDFINWAKRGIHRAMPDILATIDDCRIARRLLAGGK